MDDVGRDQFEFDRGVDRDHQLVVAEGAVRVVVAPQPLLAGRFDHQRRSVLRARRGRRSRSVGVSRALSVKTMLRMKSTSGEDGEDGGDPELDPAAAAGLARLGAAPGAEAAHGVEQSDVDRDDDDRRGEEADPKQRVDLVGARGVRRQSAAILITASGVARAAGLTGRLPILADPMRRRSRPSRALRLAVRAGAAAAIGAAIAVPLLRKRLRIPAPVTLAACAAGPARASPSSRRARSKRDVALFAMQMWAFTVVHEMPYDDPERLRGRLRTRYPIVARPRARRRPPAQRAPAARLAGLPQVGALDRFLTWTHWLWFFEPYVALAGSWSATTERFPRAARQMAAVFDVGCARLLRGADRAALVGLRAGADRRRRCGGSWSRSASRLWGSAWPKMYEALGGNPWAAMPSLHFATSVAAAISLSEAGKVEGALGWGYALTLGFGLVYLGEHYVTDLARRGAAGRRGAARRPARRARWFGRVSEALQRLERIAERVASPAVSARRLGERRSAPSRCRSSPRGAWCRPASSSWSCSVGIYFLFPKLVGLGDALSKLDDADPVWIGIAIGFNIVSYATYIALFKAVVGGDALRLTWGETYEINMAGVAATLLFSAGGAGGVAAHLLGAAQSGDAAPRRRPPDGRLRQPPLRLLSAGADRLRPAAADRRPQRRATRSS